MAKVKLKYEVHEVPDDERTRRHIVKLMAPAERKRLKKAGKPSTGFGYEDMEDKRQQYDVYFPNGQSMRVIGEDELLRLGFHIGAGLVDMETGEDVEEREPTSLKEQVERTTQRSRLQSKEVMS